MAMAGAARQVLTHGMVLDDWASQHLAKLEEDKEAMRAHFSRELQALEAEHQRENTIKHFFAFDEAGENSGFHAANFNFALDEPFYSVNANL